MAIGQSYYDSSVYSWGANISSGSDLVVEGRLGIGMANPSSAYMLDVHGTIHADGAGLAESVLASSDVEAADGVVIDTNNHLAVKKSSKPYDLRIAGIISSAPGLWMGEGKTKNYKPLVLAGQVPCKVTTSNGPIMPGDLLAVSSKPGYAMKVSFVDYNKAKDSKSLRYALMENEKRRMSVIAKALEPLKEGDSTITVLLMR